MTNWRSDGPFFSSWARAVIYKSNNGTCQRLAAFQSNFYIIYYFAQTHFAGRTHACREPSRAAKEEKAKLLSWWRRRVEESHCGSTYFLSQSISEEITATPLLSCSLLRAALPIFLWRYIYVPCFIYLAGAFSLDCAASRCSAVLPGYLRKYFSTVQIGGTWAFCMLWCVALCFYIIPVILFCLLFASHSADIWSAVCADLCFKKWR